MQRDIEYTYSLRKYIAAAAGIFFISLVAGLAVASEIPGVSQNYLEMFKQSLEWIKTLDPCLIMLVIFSNNALKAFAAVILGIGLGIVPLFFVAANGAILGMFTGIVSRQQGTLFVIAAILPHGIIEIPMLLLSVGIGFRLGYMMYQSLKGISVDIKQEFKQGVMFFIKRIVPLLFVAAAI